MKKIIFKGIILILFVLIFSILYLSTIGIKTNKFNSQISNQIKSFNDGLEIELNNVSVILDPFKFKINLKTIGVNLKYKNKTIQLEKISSNISIKSLLNNQFSLEKLNVSTKSVKIKNVISFIRLLNNNTKLFIAEKFIKQGYLIANIDIQFDNEGKIKDNYNIKGFVKNGKISVFNKYKFSNIDFIFDLKKNNYELDNFKLSLNEKNFLVSNLKVIKEKKDYLVSGKINNKKISLSKNEIDNLINENISKLNIDKIEFKSDNSFSFNIDKKLKFKNLKIKSYLEMKNLVFFENTYLRQFFPEIKDSIILKDHKINLDFKKDFFTIKGSGKFFINEEDKIEYEIIKKAKNINFISTLLITKNRFNLDLLNYQKKKESNLSIQIDGNTNKKKEIVFKKISLKEEENNIHIQNLVLTNNRIVKKFEKMAFSYFDKENIKNKFSILMKKKNYFLNGKTFNANKLIKNLLSSKNKDQNIFDEDFKMNISIEKTYLDKENLVKNLKGYLVYKDNTLQEANLLSSFLNNENIQLTIKTTDGEKITTLYSAQAKPLVNRYKFIKGFDEGSLDFSSIKKNKITNSTLRIYNFKLKEVPALTKILTLASLQGIADLLSGEGIRFNEFEMKFSNNESLMTIDEIYAIGPAISILMSGYVKEDELISLRGTLVPATTLNKTIGSIPILGDILVGKKTGEGVFGVSFKIKGPPNKLETSVNPIKTLTPRFITRTLEKIKKN